MGAQVGCGDDKIQVEFVASVEHERVRAPLRPRPERGALLGELFRGKIVQQLLDPVGKQLFKAEAGLPPL